MGVVELCAIRPIHTEADYKATLKEISTLMESNPDLDTPEGDRLDILVQAYEAKHVAITAPYQVEAIKFRMDQSSLSVKDLEPIIGKSNRVYEVLSRKRPLTLAMTRRLHKSLGIPADVLIAERRPQGDHRTLSLASTGNSVVMGASVLERKMHYPVMAKRQVAFRWKFSLKTLWRWRLERPTTLSRLDAVFVTASGSTTVNTSISFLPLVSGVLKQGVKPQLAPFR
jgi:HTH-type transcriptional regulator/antitoxin HigA